MNPRIVEVNGVQHQFPADATDEEISQALEGMVKQDNQAKVRTAVANLRKTINTPAGGKGYERKPEDISIAGEPLAGEDRGILSGVWRATKNTVKMPYDMAKSAFTPQDDTDLALMTMSSGPAPGQQMLGPLALLAKHTLWDPGTQEMQKAYDAYNEADEHPERDKGLTGWVAGPTHRGNMHAIASHVPVVGPLAANLVERAVGGDPTGAIAEGTTYAAVPEVTEKVGKGSVRLLKKTANKVMYPNADLMQRTPAAGQVNPVEAHTPVEIKEFAQEHNIPITAAELTDSGPLRSLQSVGEKSLTGSGLLKEHKALATGAVHKLTKEMSAGVSPDAVTGEIAGRMMRDQVTELAKKSKSAADTKYAQWRSDIQDAMEDGGGLEVDLSHLNKKYGDMMSAQESILDNIPSEQASKIRALLDKASKFGERVKNESGVLEEGAPETEINPVMDIDSVKEMRSHWLDAQRELVRKGRATSREAALATQIASDLDDAMASTIEHHFGPEGVEAWREANTGYKTHMDRFYGDDSILTRIREAGDTDLAKLPDSILEKGTGGNPAHIRQLREAGVDLGPLQRTVIDKIHNSGFSNVRNTLGGFEDDFLQQLFADKPKVLNDLYKTAKIGRSVRVDTNPSNTGGALSATQDVETFATAATMLGEPTGAAKLLAVVPGVKRLAAGLTTSKWFNDWMTRVPKGGKATEMLQRGGNGPSGGPGVSGPHGDPRPITPSAGPSGTEQPGNPGGGIGDSSKPKQTPSDSGAVSKLKRGTSRGSSNEDTSFDFGANKKESGSKPEVTNNPTASIEAFEAAARQNRRVLDNKGGGGMNYTADDLAAFKAKHAKFLESGQPERRVNYEEPDPLKEAVSKDLDKRHASAKLEQAADDTLSSGESKALKKLYKNKSEIQRYKPEAHDSLMEKGYLSSDGGDYVFPTDKGNKWIQSQGSSTGAVGKLKKKQD